MERKRPVSGEFYKHFKGNLYQIKMLARDCETQAVTVVYQEMYPPFQCWVRELKAFMESVDREKYPDCPQQYCFEKVEITQDVPKEPEQVIENMGQPVASDDMFRKAITSGQPERYLKDVMTEEQVAERGFLALLDAETFREKRQIFIGMQNYLTPLMLSNIAVALDIVLEEGEPQEQYESILRCLEAFEHYEGGRLR